MPEKNSAGIYLTLASKGVTLEATLRIPDHPKGIVVFAHGSGSNRFSPRNRSVAEALHRAGLATLLLDLLTPEEADADRQTERWRFDIPLMAERLTNAVDWVNGKGILQPVGGASRPRSVGLFGASTGAAVALITAAQRPETIGAVVSRGGRPDLATTRISHVRCPTLLIVGGADREVRTLNEQAALELRAPHRLVEIPGASHLFTEPGALEMVGELAQQWFCLHLRAREAHPGRTMHEPPHLPAR